MWISQIRLEPTSGGWPSGACGPITGLVHSEGVRAAGPAAQPPPQAPRRPERACARSVAQACLTLQPRGPRLTGLLCPRGFPGKNACSPPGDLPDPGMEPASPALSGGSSTSEPPGKPVLHITPCFPDRGASPGPASHFPPREGHTRSLQHLRSCWDSPPWSSSLMGDWQTPKELSIHPAGPTPWSSYLSACPRYWPRNTWNPTHVPSLRRILSSWGPPVPAVDLRKKWSLTLPETQPDGSVCPEDKKPSQSAFCSHWVWVLSLLCYSHSSQVACHSSSM